MVSVADFDNSPDIENYGSVDLKDLEQALCLQVRDILQSYVVANSPEAAFMQTQKKRK